MHNYTIYGPLVRIIFMAFCLILVTTKIKAQCNGMPNGTLCDDGNPCTINDVCFNGICQGTPKNCSDGNPCTDDFCNSATGLCYHVNNTAACTDGNNCTVDDVCANGVCTPGSPLECPSTPCKQFSHCDPNSGCVYIFTNDPCNDGNLCTTNDYCLNGVCTGTPVVCPDDNNPCTSPFCLPLVGCVFVFNNNFCNDGDTCTVNDICINGVCQGVPKNCNDNNPCTDDFCNGTDGNCVHVFNTANCSDNNACTVGDYCANGICISGVPLICNDGNPCTDDSCNPSSGCIYTNNSNPCDDGNPCTDNDACVNGSCQGTFSPAVLEVTTQNNSGPGSLRNLVQNACTGDTIIFNPSVDTVFLNTQINVNNSVIIKGNGVNNTFINGQLNARAFIINAGNILALDNVSFINCKTNTNGGAFFNQGVVTMKFVNFENNFEGSVKKAFTSTNNVFITQSGTVKIFD